ncbi:MAG: hypothetical protein ACLP9L_02450 [Thermoguttaceae bacterium]
MNLGQKRLLEQGFYDQAKLWSNSALIVHFTVFAAVSPNSPPLLQRFVQVHSDGTQPTRAVFGRESEVRCLPFPGFLFDAECGEQVTMVDFNGIFITGGTMPLQVPLRPRLQPSLAKAASESAFRRRALKAWFRPCDGACR